MNIELLKEIIIENQELLSQISLIKRRFTFEAQARYVFVGIRQAGKSYLLYQRADALIEEGHLQEEMLFINFDDERLLGFRAEDLDMILQAYSSLFPYRPILFLDEIQNIEGWEHFARRLANSKYQVYITGSNAKMLSRDIATTLGHRFLEQRVFPFSFKEFLKANGVEIPAHGIFGQLKGTVDRLLQSYFQWGGFPELTLFTDKRKWLNQLFEKIILADIIQRNGVRNEYGLRLTLRRLAENIKTPTSYNRLANIVRAAGMSTTATSVMDYLAMCKESCLLFDVENFASKFAERVSVKKHYFTDNGLLNIFLTNSETTLLENICAITLYKRSVENQDEKFYYYNKEWEIDFYIPELKKGIQASYSLADTSTYERETRALIEFHKKYGLKEAVIVTYSEMDTITADDLTIHIVPLAKWLLSYEE